MARAVQHRVVEPMRWGPGILAAALLSLAPHATVAMGNVHVSAAGSFSVPVVSYVGRRFLTVVRQQYDYSCGSAVVATLLSYHYERPTSEAEVFAAMWEAGDRDRIRDVGFSLLDIKRYLEGLGYQADGFRVPISAVADAQVPAIMLIETNGYRHFVVVKGIANGEVLVGDPAFGIMSYSIEAFEALRIDDIAFIIRNHPDQGRASFGRVEEWRLRRAAAPLDLAIARPDLDSLGRLARLPPQLFGP